MMMLPMFRVARRLSIRTWLHNSGPALSMSNTQHWKLRTLVQMPAMSTSRTVDVHSNMAKTSTAVNRKSKTVDSAAAENKQLDIRSPPRSNKRFEWTDEKDAALREGIANRGKDGWKKVAEFMGGDMTYHQCYRRSLHLEGLARVDVKHGAWDQEEVRRLEELVPQYLVHSYWSTRSKKMTNEYTDWKGVGKELGRLSSDCSNKWKNLQCGKMKKGHFTAEEDALIRQRVAEYKGEGSGLWTALQKEMGRPSDAIQGRYNIITCTFQQADGAVYWTDELDVRLTEGVAKHKAEGWVKVAEYVGGGITATQCMNRWIAYVGAMQHGNVKRGAWDPDEVERLAELVPQHLVPSYLSTRGRMTKEYIEWNKVAAKLGRLPADCSRKWISLQNAKMKKGPFSDSESAIIRHRVEGWGDKKKKGLWVALEKDLGRPAKRIRVQWINVISKE